MNKLRKTYKLFHYQLVTTFPSRCYLKRNSSTNSVLGVGYDPKEIENKLDDNDYFRSDTKSRKSFSMILPPPNITGSLHLGHALTATIQDVIVRWKRMQGIETVWIPGIDHAGIATQVVVEKRLWKENHQTRHDMGRSVFQEAVWQWKRENADVIGGQLRRLGASLDWSYETFTMDAERSRAVAAAFVRLFDAGLIYRADHLVNWSCVLRSTISDIEVEHLEVDGPTRIPVPGYDKSVEFGVLTHFAYKLVDSDEEIVIATTRPETMLGDVAVAVNPVDGRYSSYIGRNLWHPFRKQTIPIICDDFVDPSFGTGAVKVTPGHDHIDFDVGKRHSLDVLQVIDEMGNIADVCAGFVGMRRFDAKDAIVGELERLQLLRGRRDHRMIVPICSRSKDVVELLVRPQWFVECAEMARKAADDVRVGRLAIEPKHFEKTWFNWLENMRDWCVSRQLWWGHRIPAYSCRIADQPDSSSTVWVAAADAPSALSKAAVRLGAPAAAIIIEQDEDVLDTWFSSALLPFAVFGWPQQTDDLARLYPLDLMETGHDILFFWVARMVMLGTYLTGELPFRRVLLHGVLCDAHGRKMSKSLGNVIVPENIINGASLEELEAGSRASYEAGILSSEELKRTVQGQRKMFPGGIPACGADALRFTLCSHNIKNHFINFDVQECHTNKLFGNKIWQATKFTNIWCEKVFKHHHQQQQEQQRHLPPVSFNNLKPMDVWILSRLTAMIDTATSAMHNENFYIATGALKNFLYYEFCDVYLETTKRGLRQIDGEIAAGHCWTLVTVLDAALRTLAPFMPRLAHHLHRHLPRLYDDAKQFDWPTVANLRNESLERDVDVVLSTVVAIRRLKKLFGVIAKHRPEVLIVSKSTLYAGYSDTIRDLAGCQTLNIVTEVDKAVIKDAVKDNVGANATIYLIVPEELRKAFQVDTAKLNAQKDKLRKKLDNMSKIVADVNYQLKATSKTQEAHAKRISSLNEKLERINYIQRLSLQ